MNILKFELSVLFTKTDISPYSGNDVVSEGYKELFKKEVDHETLANMIQGIIDEQYNGYVQEIPEDYEI